MKKVLWLLIVLSVLVASCGSKDVKPLGNIKHIVGVTNKALVVIEKRDILEQIKSELSSAGLERCDMVAGDPSRLFFAGTIEYTDQCPLQLVIKDDGYTIMFTTNRSIYFKSTQNVSTETLKPLLKQCIVKEGYSS